MVPARVSQVRLRRVARSGLPTLYLVAVCFCLHRFCYTTALGLYCFGFRRYPIYGLEAKVRVPSGGPDLTIDSTIFEMWMGL